MRILLIILSSLMVISCKKDYTCVCTNNYGTYTAGEITTTKSKAKTYCKELSSGDTQCSVK